MAGSRKAYGLRRGRCSAVGGIYTVTCVTEGRQPLFSCWSTARLLISQLRCLHDSGDVQSLAWVVMPDHFHWMFQLEKKIWLLSFAGSKRAAVWQSIPEMEPADVFGRKVISIEPCAVKMI